MKYLKHTGNGGNVIYKIKRTNNEFYLLSAKNYIETEKINSYDKDGNYLGKFEKEKHVRILSGKDEPINDYLWTWNRYNIDFQIDYQYYKFYAPSWIDRHFSEYYTCGRRILFEKLLHKYFPCHSIRAGKDLKQGILLDEIVWMYGQSWAFSHSVDLSKIPIKRIKKYLSDGEIDGSGWIWERNKNLLMDYFGVRSYFDIIEMSEYQLNNTLIKKLSTYEN